MRKHFAYAKTNAQISFTVTAKLISAFVFTTEIVQFLLSLNLNFLLCLYSLVCVRHVRKPEFWFSHDVSYMYVKIS